MLRFAPPSRRSYILRLVRDWSRSSKSGFERRPLRTMAICRCFVCGAVASSNRHASGRPPHQTISEAQTQRFADGEVFERLLLRTVALCKEQGFIDGSHLAVDGFAFHAEANAALRACAPASSRSQATPRRRRATLRSSDFAS